MNSKIIILSQDQLNNPNWTKDSPVNPGSMQVVQDVLTLCRACVFVCCGQTGPVSTLNPSCRWRFSCLRLHSWGFWASEEELQGAHGYSHPHVFMKWTWSVFLLTADIVGGINGLLCGVSACDWQCFKACGWDCQIVYRNSFNPGTNVQKRVWVVTESDARDADSCSWNTAEHGTASFLQHSLRRENPCFVLYCDS